MTLPLLIVVLACTAFDIHICDGDIDRSGVIDIEDLNIVLADWGGPGPGDINNDGTVDTDDLNAVLSQWSESCDPIVTPLFRTPTYIIGTDPGGVVLKDLDRDGRMDFAVLGDSGFWIYIYKGLGGGSHEFAERYEINNHAIATFALGDLNSDRYDDMLVVDEADSALVTFLNDGSGNFINLRTSMPLPEHVDRLRLADMDGDHIVDLVISATFAESHPVWIASGRGDGTFEAPMGYGSPRGPHVLEIADVDLDGDFDVLTAMSSADNLIVYRNDGSGTLAAATPVYVGSQPTRLVVSDMDGDGYPDIALRRVAPSRLSVFRNDGGGNFSLWNSYSTGTDPPRGLWIADIDADGDTDLLHATITQRIVRAYLNDGNANFPGFVSIDITGGVVDIAVGYVDEDDTPDLLATSREPDCVTLMLGDGGVEFGGRLLLDNAHPAEAFDAGRMNADDRPDFVVEEFSNSAMNVFVSVGEDYERLNFVITDGVSFREISVGDLNGDGYEDIAALVSTPWVIRTWMFDGVRSLEEGPTFSPPGLLGHLELVDLNQDGLLDIVGFNEVSGVHRFYWYFGVGEGRFAPIQSYSLGNASGSAAIADWNGDGLTDLIVSGPGPQEFLVAHGIVGGGFEPSVTHHDGWSKEALAAGNLDSDSDAEVVIGVYATSPAPSGLRVVDRTGMTSIAVSPLLPGIPGVSAIEVRDLNSDGLNDIVVRARGLIGFYQNRGGLQFDPVRYFFLGTTPVETVIDDANGDGVPDIVGSLITNEAVGILYGNILD